MTTTTRWFSLRRRMLLLLLGGVTIGWLASMVLTWRDAHHEIDQIFDAYLVQMAQTLLALAGEYDDDDDVAYLQGAGHRYQKNYSFQLWDYQQRLLLRSARAPGEVLSNVEGFSERSEQGHRWRFYRQWDRHRRLFVIVGENHHVREEISGHIVLRLLAPGLIGLPLLGLWIWFATRRSLGVLDAVADQVTDRAVERLTSLTPPLAPEEVRPLINAINGLFARVNRALDNERRFTADAAHELRTPLAALAAQAQVAQRARDAGERDHAITQVVAGAQRATRLLEQLLLLARLDPGGDASFAPASLPSLAARVCADAGGEALRRNISLELEAPAQATAVVNADLLCVLLRNLIDNALRHTPAGARVRVALVDEGETVVLQVSDDGPGVAAEQRQMVLRRFHRAADAGGDGSGLGLSIVARIAELHEAALYLQDGSVSGDAVGLTVRLVLRKRETDADKPPPH